LRRDDALKIAKISKHQYYYQPKPGKQGRCKTATVKSLHGTVNNTVVVEEMMRVKKDPVTDYGYIKMTFWLQLIGYIINKKKVYDLMKTNCLLKVKHKFSNKQFVKYRMIMPLKPLKVLEMDIKFVWIEEYKKHACVLTVIDTFTRYALHHFVSYSITKNQVKQFWEHVIVEHLQGYLLPNETIDIEVRNDNDKRFSAQTVRDYFAENHLSQVFTHPYTPQENGHIESFHSILSEHLSRFNFWSIHELEQNLTMFYQKYNNLRLHASIAYLSPADFWTLWDKNLIQMTQDMKLRKTKFKLKIPYQMVKQHTGNAEPEGCSLHLKKISERAESVNYEEMVSADSPPNKRFNTSPSVVPCFAKI